MLGTIRSLMDFLTSGPGAGPLTRVLEVAANIASAPAAVVLLKDATSIRFVAIRGLASALRAGDAAKMANPHLAFGPAAIVTDPGELMQIRRPPGIANWAWLARVPVPLPGLHSKIALVCADMRADVSRGSDVLERLTLLAAITADQINLVALIAAQADGIDACASSPLISGSRLTDNAKEQRSRLAAFAAPDDGSNVEFPPASTAVVKFLADSLIVNVRLRHRNDISYHAVRRWRAPIKQWQLDAIKALKQTRDPGLIDLMAAELAATARRLYGTLTGVSVTSVPCGNSGPDCAAQRVAQAVAVRLGIPAIRAFVDIETSGTSHPRRNGSRPPMQLRESPGGPILLIDDVATSGAHVAEAVRLLSRHAPSVLPMVWLADA